MKSYRLLLLIPIFAGFSFAPIKSFDAKAALGFSPKEYFHLDAEPTVERTQTIHFANGDGYWQSFSSNGKTVGSLLFQPSDSGYSLLSSYTGDFCPVEEGKDYCLSPLDFVARDEFEKSIAKSNAQIASAASSTSLTDNTDPSSYFDVTSGGSVDSRLYQYTSSEFNEAKIKDVPQYLNQLYGSEGCVPTSAAMYFAYLEDIPEYSNIADHRDLPLDYYDDKAKVDSFIQYLGNNYFDTKDGTYPEKVVPGLDDYLTDHGYGSYKANQSSYSSEFQNAIVNAANPALILLQDTWGQVKHCVLGIGFKMIQGNGAYDEATDFYVISHYAHASNESEVTFRFSIDKSTVMPFGVWNFVFVHR